MARKKAKKQARQICNGMGSFFENLPEEDLCDEEEELLRLLCEIAHLKRSFMPTDVSIQMWAERRIPDNYIDLCNSSGLVNVQGDEHLHDAPVEDAKAYFAEMPDELTDDEVALREELVKIITVKKCNNQTQLTQLARNQIFLEQFHAVFPKYIDVQNWIQLRLVDDVEIRISEVRKNQPSYVNNPNTKKRKCDEDGVEHRKKYFVCLRPDGAIKNERTNEEWDEFRKQVQDDWFAALPEDDFSPNEDTLRCAILDFLSECPRKVALVSDVCTSKRVSTSRANLLPLYISMNKWIERRLGNDIDTLPTKTEPAIALPGSVGIDEDVDTILASQRQKEPLEYRVARKSKTY